MCVICSQKRVQYKTNSIQRQFQKSVAFNCHQFFDQGRAGFEYE